MGTPREIWLMRHGETAWSLSGAHTGRTDIPLTPAGEERAAALGRFLAGRKFELVLTSPMRRAVESCRLAGYCEFAQNEPNLCEWDYGAYEGKSTQQIRAERPGWGLWRDGVIDGETVEQVAARADLVLARIASVSGDVALFAHGHILRILAARWLSLSPDSGRLFALATAALSILGYEREQRVIIRWNLNTTP